ncbi:MAG: type IX secretion system membrane protein PorP/SprF [Cyclobacteriaceae bacterium]
MARFYIYVSLVIVLASAKAQNNIFFSHHMFNPAYYNPAWVGSESTSSVSFLYRNQWTGYTASFDGSGGAPQTQVLSFVTPVRGLPISGVGLNVSNDNLGAENNLQIQLSASYEKRLRFATLRIGVMPGIYTKTINGNEFDPNDPGDERIPNNRETQSKLNLGVGLLYQLDKGLYLGLSSVNIIEPGFDFGIEGLNNIQRRSYILHGGTSLKINQKVTLLPTAIVRTNLSAFTFDVGSIINYGDKLWTGLTYRLEESLVIYLGYNFFGNKLKAGYSFDYVVHNRDAKNPTSSEIFLRYNLPNFVLGGRKAVKTPRFTY